jgi:hypothetical protein
MPFTLKANSYHTLDFGVNLSGFIGARITVRTRTRLFLTFDEILSGGDVDFERLGCVNIVLYELEPGAYSVESFEPYTLRYLKLIVLEGDCDISDCYLRELANPEADRARFIASDERLNRIFEAARQSFRQNATDLFMDCPSRERAGWLCDSFFTARVEADLCGDTRVEKNFPEVHQANAFIGNQLGFELLSRDGRGQQILDEAIGYWLYMADRTGTLWENDTPEASCNHGFASHAAHVLIRDVLGLHSVDTIGRSIQLRFSALKLDECRGSIPTPAGPIELEWNKAGGKFTYRLITPPGYKVGIENLTGLPLMKE